MKKPRPYKKILLFCIIILAVAALVYYNSIPKWKFELKEKEAVSIPCGLTNCHGFDVSCGTPASCELVYQYGDNCRRFAHCSVVNGTCQISKDDRFEECKACVLGCVPLLEQDYLKGMECEYRCSL